MPTRATYIRRRMVVASVLVGFAWVGAHVAPALAPPDVATWSPWLDPKLLDVTTTSVADEVSLVSSTDFVCGDAVALAYSLGWRYDDLDELDYVIWRESRCMPDVHYPKDPNGGSYGLTQINGYWCEPSRYYPMGYLQSKRLLASCENLYISTVNLLSALAIYDYSVVNNGNGWQPWGMPENFCASVHRWCKPPAIVGGERGG